MTRGTRGKLGRRLAATALLLLAAGVGACGDEEITDLDLLDPELVVGTYDPTTLTFDVAGQTFGEYNLLEGLQTDEVPPLLVISNDGVAQLVFLDPATGRFQIGEGSYTMLENGVQIAFASGDAPGRILLPQTLDLVYDSESGELGFSDEIQAPLGRLVDLVPELDGEPLSDPVGGLLSVVFTPR